MHRNVAAIADAPLVPRSDPKVWTTEQLQTFLESVADDRLSAMWLLAATTGLRRSELLGLTWDALALDADPPTLAVVQTLILVGSTPTLVPLTKTDTSRRTITLTLEVASALRMHRQGQLAERLAWTEGYQDRGLAFAWGGRSTAAAGLGNPSEQAARSRCGVEGSLHTLRHSHATMLLAVGVDPRDRRPPSRACLHRDHQRLVPARDTSHRRSRGRAVAQAVHQQQPRTASPLTRTPTPHAQWPGS